MSIVPTNTVLLAASLMILAVALVARLLAERQRSLNQKQSFPADYGVPVGQFGGRSMAETELVSRRQRASRRRPLTVSAAEAARFSYAWTALQCRFVDNPRGVVAEADGLVRQLLERHGYFMGDFTDEVGQRAGGLNESEQRTVEISGTSADHPTVVTTYLAAQAIITRHGRRSEADTEVLRKAVVYYRTLFQELLGAASGSEEHATSPVPRF